MRHPISPCTRPPRPPSGSSAVPSPWSSPPDGIRVNNVAPDYTPTPNLARLSTGVGALSTPAGVRAAIPMGRAGLVTDVASCVVFLASGLSGYVTGTTLHPDGGTSASSGWFNRPGSGWANHVPAGLLDGTG